jgi:hypothetical protein
VKFGSIIWGECPAPQGQNRTSKKSGVGKFA